MSGAHLPAAAELQALQSQLEAAKAAIRIGLLDLIETARNRPTGEAERMAMEVLAPAVFSEAERWMGAVFVLSAQAQQHVEQLEARRRAGESEGDAA